MQQIIAIAKYSDKLPVSNLSDVSWEEKQGFLLSPSCSRQWYMKHYEQGIGPCIRQRGKIV